MMHLNKVIEPIEISNIVIPNRIVFPAFQTNFATPDGFVTERLTRMYEKISKGGSGLIITGCVAVSDDGVSNTNCLRINKDEHIESFSELFSIIKQNGAVPAVQLFHAGRQTLSVMTGHPIVAPSAIPCPVMQEEPVELDEKGIIRIQNEFVEAALRAKKAGAELIELHGAFGYLIGGFLSPYSNKRTDKYGKDKTLFFTEIIESVKKNVGNTPISCRISADEFVEGGLTLNETREIAPKLVKAGADVISVAAGTYASMNHMAPSEDMGEGVHVNLAEGIRNVVDVPVICVGNIRTLEYANRIIAENKVDLVAIGRPQLAEADFFNKSINKEQISECNYCGTCLYFAIGSDSIACPRNPEL